MNNFTFTKETDRVTDFRIFYQPKNVVVCGAGFLFGSHVFMKIRNWITFRLECCSTPRSATGCLWPESKCVVNIIFIKTRFFKLFRSQVTGELVYNGTDNFKMCQFVGTKMLSVKEKPLNPRDSRL